MRLNHFMKERKKSIKPVSNIGLGNLFFVARQGAFTLEDA